MKVVILHDWLTGFRGGERVLEALCELFPNAPIYTLIHKKGSTSPLIESKEIVTSFLNNIPGIYVHYRKYLPLMPLAVSLMKIHHEADLIISSSHCVIKGLQKPKNSKHFCYVHSPMRYMYDQFENYFNKAPWYIKYSAWMTRPFLIWWDKRSNTNVDFFAANSSFVQKRIQRYYELDSTVVYPFVDLKDFQSIDVSTLVKEDFYLMVTAFAPNKKLDIAIHAFNLIDRKLVIIGSASKKEIEHFEEMCQKDNIKFLGDLSREEVVFYMQKAKGFIFPGVEDFGITPLEAMASATPVIAFQGGGVLETVTHETGVFFPIASPASLVEAIDKFEKIHFDKSKLIKRAQEFSKEKFVKNFLQFIKTHMGDPK